MTSINKSDVVRARIESKVKKDAEGILKRLGVSHSTFINMSYRAVVEAKGIHSPSMSRTRRLQRCSAMRGSQQNGRGIGKQQHSLNSPLQ